MEHSPAIPSREAQETDRAGLIEPLQQTAHHHLREAIRPHEEQELIECIARYEQQARILFNSHGPTNMRAWLKDCEEEFSTIAATLVVLGHPIEEWEQKDEDDQMGPIMDHMELIQACLPEPVDLSYDKLVEVLRFAGQLRTNPRAREFVEALGRLYVVESMQSGIPSAPLPFYKETAHNDLPYVDLVSGPRALEHMTWLRGQQMNRPVYFNDTAVFTQANIDEARQLYCLDPMTCHLLSEDVRMVPDRFPTGSIGTLKMSDAGAWLQDMPDDWYRALLERIASTGSVVISATIPYEPDIETFEWVDLQCLDERTLERISTSSTASVYWTTKLLAKAQSTIQQMPSASWQVHAGSLDREGCFHPALLPEGDSWTLACIFTRLS